MGRGIVSWWVRVYSSVVVGRGIVSSGLGYSFVLGWVSYCFIVGRGIVSWWVGVYCTFVMSRDIVSWWEGI